MTRFRSLILGRPGLLSKIINSRHMMKIKRLRFPLMNCTTKSAAWSNYPAIDSSDTKQLESIRKSFDT